MFHLSNYFSILSKFYLFHFFGIGSVSSYFLTFAFLSFCAFLKLIINLIKENKKKLTLCQRNEKNSFNLAQYNNRHVIKHVTLKYLNSLLVRFLFEENVFGLTEYQLECSRFSFHQKDKVGRHFEELIKINLKKIIIINLNLNEK